LNIQSTPLFLTVGEMPVTFKRQLKAEGIPYRSGLTVSQVTYAGHTLWVVEMEASKRWKKKFLIYKPSIVKLWIVEDISLASALKVVQVF
jgi:hypothetical protein